MQYVLTKRPSLQQSVLSCWCKNDNPTCTNFPCTLFLSKLQKVNLILSPEAPSAISGPISISFGGNSRCATSSPYNSTNVLEVQLTLRTRSNNGCKAPLLTSISLMLGTNSSFVTQWQSLTSNTRISIIDNSLCSCSLNLLYMFLV